MKFTLAWNDPWWEVTDSDGFVVSHGSNYQDAERRARQLCATVAETEKASVTLRMKSKAGRTRYTITFLQDGVQA